MEFPSHFSDTDRPEPEIQDMLTEMDTYDPDSMKPLHERDRKLEERIKKLVETTKEKTLELIESSNREGSHHSQLFPSYKLHKKLKKTNLNS